MIRLLFLVLGFAASVAAAETRTLVFFGDSLTAGYGVDPEEAFPAVIRRKVETAGLPWRVVAAGLSGETTAGGLRRIDWILRQRVDLIVLELGANDGLRGVPLNTTRTNLEEIIGRIRQRYPAARIVLAGMQVPPNLGPEYTSAFARIYPDLAAKCHVGLIPFLLEGVGGHPELNQGDGLHPTAEGQAKVAENVWSVLHPLL